MRLRGRRGSRNIEDRRRQGDGRAGKAAPIGRVGSILVLAIGYFAGIDVTPLLQQGGAPQQSETRQVSAEEKRAGRVPQPHTFTHGTSKQRASWFAKGFKTGDINQCDTFSARRL